MMLLAAGGGLCAAAGWMTYAVRGRSASIFGRSVYRGPRGRRAIALTFDDGPSERTEEILGILERHGVRATFFQCGANVERLPRVARAVAASGHEIGNHSHTHARLQFRSGGFIEAEFTRAQRAIAEATGIAPVLLRAPYGVRWFGFDAMQKKLGLVGVMWTVIGNDWKLPAEAIVTRVEQRVSDGGIICLHDGRELERNPDIEATVTAVGRLVPRLIERGYRFETVSQLVGSTSGRETRESGASRPSASTE